MQTFAIALFPVLLIIAAGFVLRSLTFLEEGGWRAIERVTYFILFPVLLVSTLANQHLSGMPWQAMLTVILLVLGGVSVALVTWYLLFSRTSPAGFTSIFQGGVRFNAYITLTVALALYGQQGLVLASVAIGMMIFFINLLCVAVFVIWGSGTTGIKAFVREVLTNPLIIACLLGWFLSISDIGIHVYLYDSMQMLGRAALPLGLLTVGAALNLRALRHHAAAIFTSTLFQFLVKPFAIYFVARYTGLGSLPTAVLLIAFMTPTSPSSYILARQLGGDADTMASIITFQTLAAFAVMPLLAELLLFR